MFTCKHCFLVSANEGGECEASPTRLHAPKAYAFPGQPGNWDEEKHPREGKGKEGGGRFAPKEGGGGGGEGSDTVNGIKATHALTKRIWSHTEQKWYEPGTKVVISKQGKGGAKGRSQVMFKGGHIAVVSNADLKSLD